MDQAAPRIAPAAQRRADGLDLYFGHEAANGSEALLLARERTPDVVLMDIRMPNVDGIEATARLTVQSAPSKVLMLTTFDRDEYVYRAMRAGASGFLLKDARRLQLLRAIRTVAAGDALVDPSITMRLIEHCCQPAETSLPLLPETLTQRELEVLKVVARSLSNAEIAAGMSLSEATVKTPRQDPVEARSARSRTGGRDGIRIRLGASRGQAGSGPVR